MGQFSNSFPKHFSYLCEYAFRFDQSCSFCEYPFIFHCLHCSPSCFDPDSLLLAHLWLGLSWIYCISANKSFSSPKTSSRKPYPSSKQQERQKHSVETTINFSRQAVPLPHTHRAADHHTGPPGEHPTPPTPRGLLTRYHRWYARRSIQVPAKYTKCICDHAEEGTWDHFKGCPLYRGLDTLTDWNPTETIAQHAGWLTRSPATQQLATIPKQTEVLEAVRRGLVPTAVYTLLRTHAEDPQATAAHMQRTAIAKTAEQLTYFTHRYLQHAATLPQTDQAHLLKLLFYQP